MTRRVHALIAVLAATLLLPGNVWAQVQATLSRDRIAAGETTTLTIDSDGSFNGAPDFSPLRTDFDLSGQQVSQRMELINGTLTTRSRYSVALRPKRGGTLQVPPLRVGSRMTPSLLLIVEATSATAASDPASKPPLFNRDSDVVLRAQLETATPYVQQAVGFVLRLSSRTPILSGTLEQPQPDGARLQQMGDDVRYTQTIDGREVTVVERRFLLIPERAGSVVVPPARFSGVRMGGFFDDLFGDGRESVDLPGQTHTLQVRGIPASAPQPWLPLRDLRLHWQQAPTQGKAGEAISAVLQADVDGGTAAQLPELVFPADAAVQVFTEPVQTQERFDAGRPQVRLTRRYTLLPLTPGSMRLAGPRLAWWDVVNNAGRVAQSPDLMLQIAPGAGSVTAPNAADPSTSAALSNTTHRMWPWIALAMIVLALTVLLWWNTSRRVAATAAPSGTASPPSPAPPVRVTLADALQAGSLAVVTEALLQLSSPPACDLDALGAQLDDVAQQAAIDALQQARWAGGDEATARAALRSAFAHGPRWRVPPARDDTLPPLYPDG